MATETEKTEEKKEGLGRGWHGDGPGHAAAGRKGGRKVSLDRNHMAKIGRKGGTKVSQNREHMAEIGRKGGRNSRNYAEAKKGQGIA